MANPQLVLLLVGERDTAGSAISTLLDGGGGCGDRLDVCALEDRIETDVPMSIDKVLTMLAVEWYELVTTQRRAMPL